MYNATKYLFSINRYYIVPGLCFDQPVSPFSLPVNNNPSKFLKLQDKLNNQHGGLLPDPRQTPSDDNPSDNAGGEVNGTKPDDDFPKLKKGFKFNELLRRKRAFHQRSIYQCAMRYTTEGDSYVWRKYGSQCCTE